MLSVKILPIAWKWGGGNLYFESIYERHGGKIEKSNLDSGIGGLFYDGSVVGERAELAVELSCQICGTKNRQVRLGT